MNEQMNECMNERRNEGINDYIHSLYIHAANCITIKSKKQTNE